MPVALELERATKSFGSVPALVGDAFISHRLEEVFATRVILSAPGAAISTDDR